MHIVTAGMMDFSNLSITSPKRVRTRPSGWDAFFPYYAGYPLSFASNLIGSARLPKGSRVFDPWNGSGTTTFAALDLGLEGIGVDLNPAMVVIARARSLQPSEADSLLPLAREIVAQASKRRRDEYRDDPLSSWFDATGTRSIRSIEIILRRLLVGDLTVPSKGGQLEHISPIAAALYVSLFSTCRVAAQKFKASNPTWLKKAKHEHEKVCIGARELHRAFLLCVERMAESLRRLPLSRANDGLGLSLKLGDSTQIHTADRTVDLVLSSPPYCTRIDYTAATRIELAVLSYLLKDDLESLARDMIGSVKVPNHSIAPNATWGAHCNSFIEAISKHPSKASSGYYLRTHLDYFNKMMKSIDRLSNSMKDGAAAILVVQDSYYKDIHNNLPLYITEMATSARLNLFRRDDFAISATLSSMNPRSIKYIRPRGATESVLCFRKS